ncbi:MAG: cellulase family glycosylhydrolase [Bacteroidetes bacterium]|nr:cellulase family glycosylhydrolase [Bacteroidota bacterium]
MKKTIAVFFLLLLAKNSFAGKFVYQDGDMIRDSTGKAFQLNGVNLGGWLLWEGWIWGGGFTKESTLNENFETIAGKTEADSFRLSMYRNFITEDDIHRISLLGLNVVRIPFNHRIFEPINGKIYGWEILDRLLGWCRKYHVYAILDMHGAPGGQSPYFISDPVKPDLWKDQQEKIKTGALWKEIAEHFSKNNIVAGYDLLNEPIPNQKDSLVKMYEQILAAIRSVDSLHLCILEGSDFAKDFSMFKKLPDKNMMFSFHIYTWLGGDPSAKVLDFSDLSEKLDVPVWCGEWGENNYTVIEKTLKTFADTTNRVRGWCFWTWKKVFNDYATLNSINITESWSDVIKWCSNPLMKDTPPHDDAVAAMKEFEKAVLYSNTTHDARLEKLLTEYAMVY